ncbi:MAG: ABC transporter permease, partial [Clostridiaceae bacterium]|nr:ABC transporter permease [Clostridiaceae bacterium]
MKKYLLKRVIMAIVTIWAVVTVTFILMHSVPGDPFIQGNKMPKAVYENLLKKYGLDKPYTEQYMIYLGKILRGDFGDSMKSRVETVNDMIRRGFPVSALIGLQALLTAFVFGPALGIIAALNHNKWPDHMSMIIAVIGVSVPSFIMGTVFIQFLARNIEWLPIGGWGSFRHSILPSLSLALMPLAQLARYMRSSMLEVMEQDYIKTARSKGISKVEVVIRHAV